MRSWNISSFVDQYGAERARKIWGVTTQAVYKAIDAGRDIQILELKDGYEVRESKLLATNKLSIVKLDDVRLNRGL